MFSLFTGDSQWQSINRVFSIISDNYTYCDVAIDLIIWLNVFLITFFALIFYGM